MTQLEQMKDLERQMLSGEGYYSDPQEDLLIYGEQYPGGELTLIVGLKERQKKKHLGKVQELC